LSDSEKSSSTCNWNLAPRRGFLLTPPLCPLLFVEMTWGVLISNTPKLYQQKYLFKQNKNKSAEKRRQFCLTLKTFFGLIGVHSTFIFAQNPKCYPNTVFARSPYK